MARHSEATDQGTLSGWQLAIIAVMSHAPLIVAWVAIPGAFEFGHVVAMPLVYVLGGVTLLCAALAFVSMARRVRHPGGLYALVARGLGPSVGLGVAAVVLVSYLGSMISLYAVFGLTASGLFADIWGIDLPARFAALIGVLVVTLLGALRLRRVVWVLAALLVAQFAVLIWFDVKALRLPLPHTDLTAPLDAGWLFSGSFGIALCFALTAFIGLDTSLNFAADVRRPARSVSRAAYIAGGLMTLASALSAWAIGAATGGLAQVAVTPDVGGSGVTVFEMLARMVGPQAVSGYARLIMFVLLLATVGTGVVLSKAVGRQLSGLAGDGALPETFSVYAERHSFWSRALVPVAAAVGTFAVVSTGDRIYALWLGLAGGLGITGALSLTSIAAVVWFLRNDEEETGLVGWEGRAVAGALAAVVTAVVFLFGLTRLTSVFPATAGRPDWLLSTLIAVVFAAGLVWAAVLRRKRPEILASVGRFAAEPAAEQLAPPYRPTYTYPPASSSR